MISLNLSKCSGFTHHRSGWSYCINALRPFHSKAGILLDDFMERSFSWKLHEYHYGDNPYNLPYQKDWIGFLHNPPNPPDWFEIYNSPQAILGRKVFKESLSTCKCLVTLSEYLGKWLRKRVDVPVISVKHPTYVPPLKWSPSRFLSSYPKKIVQIGYWLRKIESIFDLDTSPQFSRRWLPSEKEHAMGLFEQYKKTLLQPQEYLYKHNSVHIYDTISNAEYDDLMSLSVIFLDLYDSSANNAVIECIARNTPILINRLDATIEYLGEDYPLYFDDLDHAAKLMTNTNNVVNAYLYMKKMDKRWLSGRFFCSDLTTKLKDIL